METSKKIEVTKGSDLSQAEKTQKTTTSEMTASMFKNYPKDLRVAIADEMFKANPSQFLKQALEFKDKSIYHQFLVINEDVINEVDILTQQTISSYSKHVEPLLNSTKNN